MGTGGLSKHLYMRSALQMARANIGTSFSMHKLADHLNVSSHLMRRQDIRFTIHEARHARRGRDRIGMP
jgi:hypothetical protein